MGEASIYSAFILYILGPRNGIRAAIHVTASRLALHMCLPHVLLESKSFFELAIASRDTAVLLVCSCNLSLKLPRCLSSICFSMALSKPNISSYPCIHPRQGRPGKAKRGGVFLTFRVRLAGSELRRSITDIILDCLIWQRAVALVGGREKSVDIWRRIVQD